MIQFARFVFDPVKLEKRKLTRPVTFPDRLGPDVLPVHAPEGAPAAPLVNRILIAAICHIGPSAYGGHYIVYLRKPTATQTAPDTYVWERGPVRRAGGGACGEQWGGHCKGCA